jgi:hypothetical protein
MGDSLDDSLMGLATPGTAARPPTYSETSRIPGLGLGLIMGSE